MSTITVSEDDPRLKIVARFMSDVMHIESKQIHSVAIETSIASLYYTPHIEQWKITAVLADQEIIFLVNRIAKDFVIQSIGFVPYWKPKEGGQI